MKLDYVVWYSHRHPLPRLKMRGTIHLLVCMSHIVVLKCAQRLTYLHCVKYSTKCKNYVFNVKKKMIRIIGI
jgi:hypothetical protein